MSATGDWLDPNLFWRPFAFHYVRYQGYQVWHYIAENADPHAPSDGVIGFAAAIKFALDGPLVDVVRCLWTGGTVTLEEFTRGLAEPGPPRVVIDNVPSAEAAQEAVTTLLGNERFWREQLDRYWGVEGIDGSDEPGDGAAKP